MKWFEKELKESYNTNWKDTVGLEDPLQSEGNTKVKKKDLEKSFDSLGRQVVGIQKFGDYVEKETNEWKNLAVHYSFD